MGYKDNAKNRKIKKYVVKIIQALKFEGTNTHYSKKIILIGAFLGIIGLFLSWVISKEDAKSAFSNNLGNVGYFLLLFYFLFFFSVFSNSLKEKIKKVFNFNIKDSTFLLLLSIIILIFLLHTFFIIKFLMILDIDLEIGNGYVVSILGTIFCLVGSIIFSKSKSNPIIHFEDTNKDETEEDVYFEKILEKKDNKDNMKLPF